MAAVIAFAGDKYVVVGNRDLYIYNVSAADSYSGFICRTINQLTGDIQTSSYPARITVTGNYNTKLLLFMYTYPTIQNEVFQQGSLNEPMLRNAQFYIWNLSNVKCY